MEGERFQTLTKKNFWFSVRKVWTYSKWFLCKVLFQTYYDYYFFVWQIEHSDFCHNVKVIFFVSVQLLELRFQHGVKHNFYRLCVKFSGTIKGIHKLSCVTWHFTSSWCRCIYIVEYILMVIITGLSNKREKIIDKNCRWNGKLF